MIKSEGVLCGCVEQGRPDQRINSGIGPHKNHSDRYREPNPGGPSTCIQTVECVHGHHGSHGHSRRELVHPHVVPVGPRRRGVIRVEDEEEKDGRLKQR